MRPSRLCAKHSSTTRKNAEQKTYNNYSKYAVTKPTKLPTPYIDPTNNTDPCKLTIKIEPGVTQNFRNALTPDEINDRINKAIKQSANDTVKQITVSANKQLKNGDLEIYANNADEANALSLYASTWIPSGAYLGTYGSSSTWSGQAN